MAGPAYPLTWYHIPEDENKKLCQKRSNKGQVKVNNKCGWLIVTETTLHYLNIYCPFPFCALAEGVSWTNTICCFKLPFSFVFFGQNGHCHWGSLPHSNFKCCFKFPLCKYCLPQLGHLYTFFPTFSPGIWFIFPLNERWDISSIWLKRLDAVMVSPKKLPPAMFLDGYKWDS